MSSRSESNTQLLEVKEKLECLLKIIGLFVAISYATGFLIVFAFLGTLGISDIATDIFRIKYVYIGMLCLVFPLALALPTMLALHERTNNSRPATRLLASLSHTLPERRDIPLWSMLILANTITVFYSLVGLAQPGEFKRRQLPTSLLLLLIAGLGVIRKWVPAGWRDRARIFLFFCGLGLDWWILKGLSIPAVLRGGGLCYVLAMSLSVWRYLRVAHRTPDSTEFYKWHVTVLRIVPVVAFYVAGVLFYSFNVYSHLPAEFGGGDYSTGADSIVCLKEEAYQTMPEELRGKMFCTQSVKVLAQSDAMIYMARSSDRGTSDTGKHPPAGDARTAAEIWKEGDFLPHTYAVSLKFVVMVSSGQAP